jgi:cytochrome c oxidase subunit 2
MSDFLRLPLLASEHGTEIDRVLILVHLLMLVLFVGWSIFFAFALFRFRKSRNPRADYQGASSKTPARVEVLVVLCEALLLVAFSIPFWAKQIVAQPATDSNPLVVRVVAQQFAWNIHYPGPDGVFGRAAVELVNEQTNPLGLDPEDPAGKDDITTINQLYLQVDRPVLVHLTSKDVIHSFGLTEFRVKQDIFPGMSIPVSFVPTMTTEEMRALQGDAQRNFEIACAQLCGLGHYRMRGTVTVLGGAEFDAWLAEQAADNEEEYDPFFL